VTVAAVTSTGNMLLKGTADVISSGALSATDSGSWLKMWSDSDNSGAGGGAVWAQSTVTTNGGDIVISGGTDPLTGFARASGSTTDYLGTNLYGQITSAGGNITIRGEGTSNTVGSYRGGIYIATGVNSGAGSIDVYGKIATALTDTSQLYFGVLVGNNGTRGTLQSTTGAINVTGTVNGSNYSNHRGMVLWPATITSTSGNITLTGTGSNAGTSTWDIQFGSSGIVVF
jgi:hypothetical protein